MIRKLCYVDNLPDEGKLKAFADSRPDSHLSLCVGVLDGQPFAVDNLCPHQGAPLSAGKLDGENVVCPLHAWKWNLKTGGPLHAGDPALPSYELRQYGDEIFIRIPTERVGKEAC